MAEQHLARGDEQSSLIAAEAANSKLPGFGSNFRFYAKLLSTFPNREEETRDAARMCLRLPLPTIGMELKDFEEVAVLGQMAKASDSQAVRIEKLKEMYDLLKQVEEEDPQSGKSAKQIAIEEANSLIDETALAGKDWSAIRKVLGKILRSANLEDMAKFVDFAQE
jgi:hypothetical protein